MGGGMREEKERGGITEGGRGEGERRYNSERGGRERGDIKTKRENNFRYNTETRYPPGTNYIVLTHDTFRCENLYHKWALNRHGQTERSTRPGFFCQGEFV